MEKKMLIKNKKGFLVSFWNFCWGIYYKNPEIWNYLIVGAIGVLISLVTFAIPRYFYLNVIISNIISWIVTVTIVYFLNKLFVFKTKNSSKKDFISEFFKFVIARIITLLIETVILYIGVELALFNDILTKVFAQIIIIILNYIFSKLFIFK